MLTAVLHLHMLTAVHTLLVWDEQTNFEERETRKGQRIISLSEPIQGPVLLMG